MTDNRISFSDKIEIRYIEKTPKFPDYFPHHIDKSNFSMNSKSSKISNLHISVPEKKRQAVLTPSRLTPSRQRYSKMVFQ